MNDVIVSRLQDVGFSLYEARLYLALLRGGAQNGNEVAKSANVPSSKVYTALEKLATKGIVQSLNSGNSVRFTALPPSELVPRLRSRFNAPLDVLADELPKVAAAEPPEPFLTVSGESALFRAACAIIGAAQNEIHLSCWQQDIAALWDVISTIDARGVRVFGMLYGEGELPAGTWLRHHYEVIVGNRVGGRLLALVVDDSEALIARIPRDGSATAVRSRNPVFTLIVQEYLHHDNILQRAQIGIGFDEWDRWWQADPTVRAEILGRALRVPGEDRQDNANLEKGSA